MATGKKAKKVVEAEGVAHVNATFNNTTVTITDPRGNAIAWGSSGKAGFKGSKKSTPFAATVAAEQCAREALTAGVKRVGARRGGAPGQVDQGRDADPAQRLPSPEASESLSMGRYTGPSCRQCRREGTKLFLKGTKCFTEKCPVERRPYAPGQHGQATARRRKASEFSKQLREKQKIKRIYGVSEKQFRNTFEKVSSQPGITGHNLLAALETRLDNVVYRMGFASSRKAARQLIRHRHVEVNQKSVDIPSFHVMPGQEVRMRVKSREQVSVMTAMDQSSRGAPLSWIAVDKETFSGRVLEKPARTSIPIAAQEQLVVELYSK